MEDEFIPLSGVISRVFEKIDINKMEESNKLLVVYDKIVRSISNCGEALSEHTRVLDIKGSVLVIESDHPGWSVLLHRHASYILQGLKMYAPELKISALSFRIKRDF